MQGDFGSKAGPRGAPHEPLPASESSIPHSAPHRMALELSANNLGFQSDPGTGQNLPPPSGRSDAREVAADADLGSSDVRRAKLPTDIRGVPTDADLGSTYVTRAELSLQTRVPTQVLLSPSENQTNSSHAPAGKRRKLLIQTPHMIEVATQNSSKPGNLKAFPSSRHAVENSGASSSQPLAKGEEEAKARQLAHFGAELSQPVEPIEMPVSKVESNKQQDDVDFPEATAIYGLCPYMFPEHEMGERERKRDLDKHKWLDGDGNKTMNFRAVKEVKN